MTRKDYLDRKGRACKTKAKPMKWGNTNINIQTGVSNSKIKQQLEFESQRYENYAPWYRQNWQIQYRDPVLALEILCLDHLESKCTQGLSNFHYKLVKKSEIKKSTQNVSNEWDIPLDEPYYVWSKTLGGAAKGDDANIDKVFFVYICLIYVTVL